MTHDLTLAAAFAERADSDALALVEIGPVERRATFAELDLLAARLAATLDARGVRRGDVVGVWLPNVIETVALELALARLGASVLGINTRYGEHELAHLLSAGRPVGLIAPAEFHGIDFSGRLAAAAKVVKGPLPNWVAWVGDDAGDVAGVTGYALGSVQPDEPASASRVSVRDEGVPEDLVNYFTTSGSTGLPKLAGHDQSSVVRHAQNVARAFGMRAGDMALGVLPMSGVFGFNHILAMLLAGGGTVLVPVFDPVPTVEAMARYGVTHVIGGDDLFGRLRDGWVNAGRPSLALRRGGIADFTGDAASCVAWAEDTFGADITGVYGSSEVFALTATWPAGLSRDRRRQGGGKLVSEEIRVRIADPESGVERPVGEPGEIQLEGYNVVTHYRGAGGAEAFTSDGWFRTGDLGIRHGRSDEFVYLCRIGDALRLRGFLVEPAEIERFLMDQPGVETAKVVAVPDEDGAQVVVAFVTATGDDAGATMSAEALLSETKLRLAAFKVPKLIRVVPEMPVTSGTNGTKIRTAVLRDWASDLMRSPPPDEPKETA